MRQADTFDLRTFLTEGQLEKNLKEFEEEGSPEEKAFDAEFMSVANGIASALGKELKAKHPVLALSVIDLLAMIDPTSNNKYLGLLSQLIQNRMTNRIEHESVEEFQRIATRDGYPDAIVKNAPTEQLYLTYVLDAVIDPDTIRAVNEFIDLNERKLIEQNDILKYKTLQEIQDAVSLAHIKAIDKTMASEIIRIHEDDEWLILRPLTFAASCKYGASTKWCTTAINEPHHFYRYWNRGTLIYILNKKGIDKIASENKSFENELDQETNKSDSLSACSQSIRF